MMILAEGDNYKDKTQGSGVIVNNGNFVIAPIAPVLCHSFFIFPGASSTASIAVLELKLLIFSEIESFLALRLCPVESLSERNFLLKSEGILSSLLDDICSPHIIRLALHLKGLTITG